MKIINGISRWMNYVAIGLLILLMLLTVGDVVMRYVFSSPIRGTSELASVLMTRFSPRVQAIVDSLTLTCGLFIWIIFTWGAIVQSFWEKRVNSVVGVTVDWPSYPFYWVYAVGCAVLCLTVVALIIQKLRGAAKQ